MFKIQFIDSAEPKANTIRYASILFSLQILFAINLRHLHKADTLKLHKKGVSANDEN